MTSPTITAPAPARVRALRAVLPGAAALVYAGVQLDAGVVVASLRASSTVPEDRLNFPLSGNVATTAEIVWAMSQVFLLITLAAFRRSPAVAASRAGRVGATIALVGGWLFLGGHLVCLTFRDALLSDPAGVVASTLFGIGSVLMAAGFIAAGTVVLRGVRWSGWRRVTPLAVGAWMLVMIPLQFTGLLQAAVAVHAITVGAFGVALLQQSDD
ncbi:MAG TPA: hypothetical protein VFL59_10970 [Candidatus Nanopelagicales bacterium]|nr:hypothetical protein [Candidatus Nanopelagicales bacterium]